MAKRLASAMRPTLRGVIFDMDGTLTVPNLDFAAMYERCNVPLSEDLLAAISAMPSDEKAAANAVIDEMEAEGRRTLQLNEGALELAGWLHRHGVPTAIVTRNTAVTVDHLHSQLWEPAGLPPLDPALSRDDPIPDKPDPAALHLIAEKWGVELGPELLMIGDSPSKDVVFGKAAGISTALVDSGRRFLESPDSTGGADFCVGHLALLPHMLWQHYDLDSTAVQLTKYEQPTPTSAAGAASFAGDVKKLADFSVAELSLADDSGNTPLIWAAEAGKLDVVKYLLDQNVDTSARGFLGCTAILRATRRGHIPVLQALLDANCDCNIPNSKMQSPLHFAAFKKIPEAVELLLKHGANSYVLDRKGRTPAEDTSDETIRKRIKDSRC